MSNPIKITVVGAGSASFGKNTLSALLRSKKLYGSSLALVDRNPHSLQIVHKLANRLNQEWDAGFNISAHTQHAEALPGSDFVVSAIEVGPREELWKSDFEIPLKYGIRQPYAENGGPGGFAHAARNAAPVLEIVRTMEAVCPNAWFINFSNPMMRICDLVNRYSRIKAVGLCHQVMAGFVFAGIVLAKELGIQVPEGITGMHSSASENGLRERVLHQVLPLIDIRAAGTNHFTWILSINRRDTGEDLYPVFRQRWESFNPAFEPLTHAVYAAFDLFPVPGDTHLCEYLPWVSDPQTQPWDKYNIHLYDWDFFAARRNVGLGRLESIAAGALPVDELLESDSEGALEMIENIARAGSHYHLAANLPNRGQISNLPYNAIVETPVHVDGAGIHPVHTGALPEPIAELCRRELVTAQLGIDAVVEGSYQKALQCLLLDPVIRDMDTARKVLDDYLKTYKEHLPQFWK